MQRPIIRDLFTNQVLNCKWHTFSDGAINCVTPLLELSGRSTLRIEVPPNMPANEVLPHVGALLATLTTSYIRQLKYLELFMPYLPYARADRVFEEGGCNMLRLFVDNLMGVMAHYPSMILRVADIHNANAFYSLVSELASTPVKNRIIAMEQVDIYLTHMYIHNIKEVTAVVAPDKGAEYKALRVAQALGVNLYVAHKERDPATGKILNMSIPAILPEDAEHLLIVDDICDGGGTFIGLANILPKESKKTLYVTHGIFSKGQNIEGYDFVYAAYNWKDYQ